MCDGHTNLVLNVSTGGWILGKINVAIIGAGNCASSLVQGLYKYGEIDEGSASIPGLMHNVLGGYALSDVLSLIHISEPTRPY